MNPLLIEALRSASSAEIVNALYMVECDSDRKGLAYDVGEALIRTNACKEFPGPAQEDPPMLNERVEVQGKPNILENSIATLCKISGFHRTNVSDAPIASAQEQEVRAIAGWYRNNARAERAQPGTAELAAQAVETPKSHVRSLKNYFPGPARG